MKINVGHSVTDIEPGLKGLHPEGWPPGATFEQLEGFYDHLGVVLSEYKLDANGNAIRSNRIPGATRHEIGHGVDRLSRVGGQSLSETPEFRAAWSADVSDLTEREAKLFEYFILGTNHDPGRGPAEAFADVFASVNGGSSVPSQTRHILRAFPRTSQFIREFIAMLH